MSQHRVRRTVAWWNKRKKEFDLTKPEEVERLIKEEGFIEPVANFVRSCFITSMSREDETIGL